MGNSKCLTDEVCDILSDEIQREIDNGIMFEMLEGCGWHPVKLNRFNSREHSVDVSDWLDKNNIRDFWANGSQFLFKHHRDAVLFALKWL